MAEEAKADRHPLAARRFRSAGHSIRAPFDPAGAATASDANDRKRRPAARQGNGSINNTTWADCCSFLRSEKAGRRIASPS
ncbi:hypothetical protein [Burkholderia savannae]|uniref:hypothetical protein n=1 Tax=Burkholderia savannae TaxID=1637837 RepID=UPI000A425B8E|nr:hypothetical protein [Burkholderia savannae]